MAPENDDFSFLLGAIRRLLDEISAEIEVLHPREAETKGKGDEEQRPGRRGQILAKHALDALDAIRRRVDDVEIRFPKATHPTTKKTVRDDLRFYTHIAWSTHHVLQWLQPREDQLLDLGALYFADEVALDLLGPGIEVNPIESSDYMYSTSIWPLNWLVRKRLKETFSDQERPIPIVLAFPAKEKSTMLLHCLFSHELSHAAVRVNGLVDKGLEPLKANGDYEQWLTEAEQRSGNLAPITQHLAPRFARAWIEELFCDAFAFALLGPAYLFAFAEMALSSGWSEPDEEHPSTATRTRQLVLLAERYEWSDFLRASLPQIWEWLEFASRAPALSKEQGQSFAERVCRSSFERIAELVDGVLEERRFTPDQWSRNEKHLTTLLENDILPAQAEDGKAVSHAEILNASWLQGLTKHGNDPAAISKAVGEEDYQRFVAKALEMSTVLRVWNQEENGDAAAA